MAAAYKLILPDSYFVNSGSFKLPKLLKQLRDEEDAYYETRVRNALICMTD